MQNRWFLRYGIVIASLLSGGCAEVAPWERGTLARDDMSIDAQGNLNSFRQHIFGSKEASQGGHGGAGGGCGCN